MQYVSKQIIVKNKLTSESSQDDLHTYPNTKQWLSCVGLRVETIKVFISGTSYTELQIKQYNVRDSVDDMIRFAVIVYIYNIEQSHSKVIEHYK